ncbi:MAG: hypothetical protein HQL36_08495 [Alphaproteobacteria bacterium]|nr:hypothetical protein [Alphaproteobacteria bacterium]MBF0251703.1 hypothetical protein [Alphaproteobacteria bacterium]
MTGNYHPDRVKKRWFDPFWSRKARAIEALETNQHHQHFEKYRRAHAHHKDITESEELIVAHVERVLIALDHQHSTYRWMFVKFVLAWLVAITLVTGEVPWFLSKAWDMSQDLASVLSPPKITTAAPLETPTPPPSPQAQ